MEDLFRLLFFFILVFVFSLPKIKKALEQAKKKQGSVETVARERQEREEREEKVEAFKKFLDTLEDDSEEESAEEPVVQESTVQSTNFEAIQNLEEYESVKASEPIYITETSARDKPFAQILKTYEGRRQAFVMHEILNGPKVKRAQNKGPYERI